MRSLTILCLFGSLLSCVHGKKCKAKPPHGQSGKSTVPTQRPSPPNGSGFSTIIRGSASSVQPPSQPTGNPPSAGGATGSRAARGLGWAGTDSIVAKFISGSVEWYYHWKNPPVQSASNLEDVPMLWGDARLGQFQTIMASYPNPKAILAFNEPDLPQQGNMSPQQAAQSWMKNLEPYAKKGVRLGSPAPAYNMNWMEEFFDACEALGCTIDFVAHHWYGAGSLDGFSKSVQASAAFLSRTKSKKLWVTEHGVTTQSNPTLESVNQFLQDSVKLLEQQEYVERIAWFGAWEKNPDQCTDKDCWCSNFCSMVSPSGQLTANGQFWTST